MRVVRKLLNTYHNLPVPAKASIWFVFCGVLKDAIDIFVTPLFTRILSTEEYGLFNVYNSWYQIFRVVFTLNLCSDVYTVGLAKYAQDRKRYVSSVQGLFCVLLAVLGVVLLSSPSSWASRMGIPEVLVIFLFLQVASYVPYTGWIQQKRFEYKYRIITIVTSVYVILQPLLSLLLIHLGWEGFTPGELRVMGSVSVQIVFGLVILVANFVVMPVFYDRETWKFSIRMNLPLMPHFLAQTLLLQSARLIIDATMGKGMTAVYSVANSAAFVIQVIALNLNSAFLPWLYQKLGNRQVEGTRSYTSILFLLSAASVLLIVLVAPEAMSLLGPKQYAEGVYVIPPLAFSVHLLFAYTQFSNIQLYYEKRMRVMVCAICGTAVCLGLGVAFIPVFGLVAAGCTTMAGYLTIAVMHYVFLRMTCKEQRLAIDELFNMPLILMITVVLGVTCLGMGLLYTYSPLLRYGLFATLLLVLVYKRTILLGLLSSFKQARPKSAVEEELKEKGGD